MSERAGRVIDLTGRLHARHGLLDASARANLARELFAASDCRRLDAPLEIAHCAWFHILPVHALPPREAWDGTTVFHVWTPYVPRRVNGWNEYEGLTLGWFARKGVAYSLVDVRQFMLELAVPQELRGMSLERVLREQKLCPEAILREVLENAR